MIRLPKLTELEAMGGDGFQTLMTQLLLAYAEHHGFGYRTGPPGKDGGVDGLAPDGGVPAMQGPVVFQAKWLWGDLQDGSKKRQIEESLKTVAKGRPEVRNWVLVTPHDLTQTQQKWLFALKPREDLKIHHWGHERLTGLMRKHCPDLFARYYPLHAASAAARPQFPLLLPAYLRQLICQTERLDLSSLARNTAGEEAEQAPPLAELYTRLDVLRSREFGEGAGMDVRRRAERADQEAERQSAAEFVGEHPRAALLGDPGSGKSTFASYLILVLAGEWLRREEIDLQKLDLGGMATVNLDRLGADWQAGALLPVGVVLREFAAACDVAGKPADQLWKFIAAQMGDPLADFVAPLQAHLRDEGGLLVLDGYDEVPDARGLRAFVKQAVAEFQSQLPGVRVLLTSRTYAYQAENAALPGFVATVLAPFSKEQIDLFVDSWYAHHALRKGRLAEHATGRAARLKSAIRQRPYLLDLARRPLLLTLMAALHSWRQDELPESREKLYEESVDLLLFAWERRKRFLDASGQPRLQEESAVEWFKVPQESIRKAFEEMAFTVHQEQPERTGAADIRQETVVVALMKASPNARQQHVLDYISQRAGLLIDRGNRVYCFPHRTFQEYLAARHLTEVKFPRQLVDLARGGRGAMARSGVVSRGEGGARHALVGLAAGAETLLAVAPRPAIPGGAGSAVVADAAGRAVAG